jgi:tetratricopeptide (TPR) repeat protein
MREDMPSPTARLELVPIATPAPPVSTEASFVPLVDATPAEAIVAAQPADAAEVAGRFLKEATRQYKEGHLDLPLWNRALAQAKGDKETAVQHYLQARAIALRLLNREHREERRSQAARLARQRQADAKGIAPLRVFARHRIAIISVSLVLVAAGGWLFMSYPTSKPVEPASVVRKAPASVTAPAKSASSDAASAKQVALARLMKKIEELRDAENWNVLVFYLAEWTRQEPANPDAWNALRADYMRLKQYDDALGAARKASELAPDDPRLSRHLGAAYMYVNNFTAALAAYEQALARDEADADSLTQVGMLNALAGRIPEAKSAFDRALAVRPSDATALCMRTGVAQVSAAPKDSYATGKQLRAVDAQCRGLSAAQ